MLGIHRHARRVVAVLALGAFGSSSAGEVPSGLDTTAQARVEVAVEVAGEVDPGTAPADTVVDALRDLDGALVDQAIAAAEAEAAAEAARAEAEAAAAELEAAEQRVAELRGEPPVAAPVTPPGGDVVEVLNVGAPTTVALDDDAEVTTLAEAEAERDAAAAAAASAAEAAERAATEAERAAAALEAIEERESSFVEDVEARVRSAGEPARGDRSSDRDGAPAEGGGAAAGTPKGEAAAGGEPADGDAGEVADIAAALDEIIGTRPERLAAGTGDEDGDAEEPEGERRAGEGERRAAAAGRDPARPAPAEPPPAEPAPAPVPAPAPPPLVLPDPRGSASGAVVPAWCPNGQPVIVDASIGGNVQALLNDAHAQGVDICAKSAFRPYAEQVELRRQNCGDSEHAIFHAPPSSCSPPTARPGTSYHETGLAVDFSCLDGQPMTRESPCFHWLAANAHRYHLYNLPSEPWHWSVTGR